MNRYFLYLAASALLTAACNRQQEEEDPVIPVTGITLNTSTVSLLVGATLALEAAVEPAEATNQTVTWSTSDDHVATVTPSGELIAIGAGTATITATTDDNEFTAICTVTVTETGVITMTTLASEVSIEVYIILQAGSNNLVVDWGDGQKSNTDNTHHDGPFPTIVGNNLYHSYSEASAHRITITGDNIVRLFCGGNHLTALDVSRIPELSILECGNNQLTTLDVSSATMLYWLYCGNNQLTALDVSANTWLAELKCGNNQLTKLDMSSNTSLTRLYCENNQLTTSALNDMFETLYNRQTYTKNLTYFYVVYIYGNPGTNDCDISIARERGWGVFYE